MMTFFVILTLIGFVLSALYSGLETGIYTIDRVGLAVRAARHEPGALRVRREGARPTRLLIVLLVGTNASNYVGSYGLAEILHRLGFTEWTLVLLEAAIFAPLVFIFAETLPKDLFRTHTNRWTYGLSPVLSVSRIVFTAVGILPLIAWVMSALTRLAGGEEADSGSARERVSQLIREGGGHGDLTDAQTTLADRALAMRERHIDSVMIPWLRVTALTAGADRSSREALVRGRPFTRMPVIERDGVVLGVVSWVDLLLNPETATPELVRPPLSISPRATVLEALTRMRTERRAMAFVRDSDTARPLGIVTIKDLVEPLTGRLAAW